MSVPAEVSQRDLRLRSREIMDAVESGTRFVVTRDGHQIAELVPLRKRRRFVPRGEFFFDSPGSPVIDLEGFRADLGGVLFDDALDPYER